MNKMIFKCVVSSLALTMSVGAFGAESPSLKDIQKLGQSAFEYRSKQLLAADLDVEQRVYVDVIASPGAGTSGLFAVTYRGMDVGNAGGLHQVFWLGSGQKPIILASLYLLPEVYLGGSDSQLNLTDVAHSPLAISQEKDAKVFVSSRSFDREAISSNTTEKSFSVNTKKGKNQWQEFKKTLPPVKTYSCTFIKRKLKGACEAT